jgi:hypothetical protein
MTKDVVEVSAEVALSGLYITPDIWFYSMVASKDDLANAVQRIIHDKQPLTSSYAKFGDYLYEKYHNERELGYGRYLMTMSSFALSDWQTNVALNTLVEVAISIHMKTINAPDHSIYPRIIPHELEHSRFDSAWKINRDVFRQMFMIEPWCSWIELMRGQFQRNQRIVRHADIVPEVREFTNRTKAVAINLSKKHVEKQNQDIRQAKRAIKRAVKLHDKLFGIDDIRLLMKGHLVIIRGHHFDYILSTETDKLFHHTIVRDSKMAPTWLRIRNKRGDDLGSACLYFDDTAILDHLLNVKLYASNPNTELDMIRGLHVTRVTRNFFNDPVLPELKGLHDPVTGPLITTDNILLHAQNDRTNLAQKRIMYGPLYIEAQAALQELLRFPKKYMAMIRKCGAYGLWSYISGNPQALAIIENQLEPDLFNAP